jgi:hypothetical protein
VPDALLALWVYECADLIGSNYARALAQRAWNSAWAQREPELQARADAELEACCEWLDKNTISYHLAPNLRAARRPSPPTLREQALKALRERLNEDATVRGICDRDAMELALQALQETPND